MVQQPIFEWYAAELVKVGDCFPSRKVPRQGTGFILNSHSGLTWERKLQSDRLPIKETESSLIPTGKVLGALVIAEGSRNDQWKYYFYICSSCEAVIYVCINCSGFPRKGL